MDKMNRNIQDFGHMHRISQTVTRINGVKINKVAKEAAPERDAHNNYSTMKKIVCVTKARSGFQTANFIKRTKKKKKPGILPSAMNIDL